MKATRDPRSETYSPTCVTDRVGKDRVWFRKDAAEFVCVDWEIETMVTTLSFTTNMRREQRWLGPLTHGDMCARISTRCCAGMKCANKIIAVQSAMTTRLRVAAGRIALSREAKSRRPLLCAIRNRTRAGLAPALHI